MKHIYGTTVARKKVKAGREGKVKKKKKFVLLFLPWSNILLFLFVLAKIITTQSLFSVFFFWWSGIAIGFK